MLEKMGEFFEARLNGYEDHQLTCIESACAFYPFTASCLPQTPNASILDLGCGTGLELDFYFKTVPSAHITGVDLAPGMLDELRRKHQEKSLTLILGSYFDVPFEENAFDAAVSVESLHHFTKAEKIPLYQKLRKALTPGGYFILTDYFASSEAEEQLRRAELLRLKQEQGLLENVFYHYDTPLTVPHETEALLDAGFASVTVLKSWGATYTLGVSLESWTCPIYETGSMIHLGHQRQRGVDNDPDSVGKSNQTTQRISNRQASEDGFGVFTPQP